MDLITNFKMSIITLKRQRMRSILTILGIAVGISIVIAIMAAGRGLDYLIMGELETFSPDLISIETKVPSTKQTSSENAFGQSTGITITTMKNKDIDLVMEHPNIVSAYGQVFGQDIVSHAGQTKTVLVMGEVVLGMTVKEALFGDDVATGKMIYIKGKPFRVVGVAAKRGSAFFIDMDNVIYVPTLTMQKRLLGIDYVRQIIAKMKDRSLSAETVRELEEIIREEHDITDPAKDDFAVNTMDQAREMLGSVVGGITFLLVALVCISLVVGGVGIMNIMYVSVAERTFEIGLRKAVGARKRDIMWQFLSEALLITVGGGIAGIILGALLALIIYAVAIAYGLKWVYDVPLSSIVLAVGFSTFIGFLFGLYPARKAASLDPIEALRKE